MKYDDTVQYKHTICICSNILVFSNICKLLVYMYINPSRFSWWLRDINQSTDFCIVGDAGNVFCYYASSTRFYVSMSEIKKNGLNHSSLFYNIYK